MSCQSLTEADMYKCVDVTDSSWWQKQLMANCCYKHGTCATTRYESDVAGSAAPATTKVTWAMSTAWRKVPTVPSERGRIMYVVRQMDLARRWLDSCDSWLLECADKVTWRAGHITVPGVLDLWPEMSRHLWLARILFVLGSWDRHQRKMRHSVTFSSGLLLVLRRENVRL